MELGFYIKISGTSFDAEKFVDVTGGRILGDLKKRRVTDDFLGKYESEIYWIENKNISSNLVLSEEISHDLENMRKPLLHSGGNVTVQIVISYSAGDEFPGIYTGPALVRLMGEMGADLDIDSFLDLSVMGSV